MGNYFEPVLSEEQLAAYLDGILSTEENNMIEEIISSDPEMTEIQDAIDAVDSIYTEVSDCVIPLECMADDFSLPYVDYEDIQAEMESDEDYYGSEDSLSNTDYEEPYMEEEYGEMGF